MIRWMLRLAVYNSKNVRKLREWNQWMCYSLGLTIIICQFGDNSKIEVLFSYLWAMQNLMSVDFLSYNYTTLQDYQTVAPKEGLRIWPQYDFSISSAKNEFKIWRDYKNKRLPDMISLVHVGNFNRLFNRLRNGRSKKSYQTTNLFISPTTKARVSSNLLQRISCLTLVTLGSRLRAAYPRHSDWILTADWWCAVV